MRGKGEGATLHGGYANGGLHFNMSGHKTCRCMICVPACQLVDNLGLQHSMPRFLTVLMRPVTVTRAFLLVSLI
jgi:hypothetical protein